MGLDDTAGDRNIGPCHFFHQRLQQRRLVLEIEIDPGLAEPGPGRDVVHPGGGKAFFGKEFKRSAEDFGWTGFWTAGFSRYY